MKLIERYKRWRKTDSRWQSFWFALDDVFMNNKFYKFYYKHIWTPVWRVYDRIIHIPGKIKERKQRAKKGVAYCDVWDFYEYNLQIMYYGIKEFIDQEYGDPVNWKLRECEVHTKRMYNVLMDFLRYYEKVWDMDWLDPEFNKVVAHRDFLYQKIVREYLQKIWI